MVGGKKVQIDLDVVDADVPLLLSKEAMKKAGTVLDFENDSAIMFGTTVSLVATESGHYAIPLSITTDSHHKNEQIALITQSSSPSNDSKKIALKLHRQFCHCSADRLNRLIQQSRVWSGEQEKSIMKMVNDVSEKCAVCKRFKKARPVPIVSMALANAFNHVVAMDLIILGHGKYILHLIDLFSRFSAACIRTSKRQEVIVDAILKIWISYFGSPGRFLADNGGEFANAEYNDMCEAFGIEMMKTAAESPWANGVCERHNGVLKESVLKVIEDSKCSPETAIAWAVSAKNTLSGHEGFSPNILVFGRNPNLPSNLEDKLPALTACDLAPTVEANLKAMRLSREAFIRADSCEKVKRALSHNLRAEAECEYNQGDKVFLNETMKNGGTDLGLSLEEKERQCW